jgi:hypothetical protein
LFTAFLGWARPGLFWARRLVAGIADIATAFAGSGWMEHAIGTQEGLLPGFGGE